VLLEQLSAYRASAEVRIPVGEHVGASRPLLGFDEKEVVADIAIYFAMLYALISLVVVTLTGTVVQTAEISMAIGGSTENFSGYIKDHIRYPLPRRWRSSYSRTQTRSPRPLMNMPWAWRATECSPHLVFKISGFVPFPSSNNFATSRERARGEKRKGYDISSLP